MVLLVSVLLGSVSGQSVDDERFVLTFFGDLLKVDQLCYLRVLFLSRGFQHEFYYFHMIL